MKQATGVAEVSPSSQGGSRGFSEDAAVNMSQRDRAECIVDPPRGDSPELLAPVTLMLPRVEVEDPVGDVVFSVLSVAVLADRRNRPRCPPRRPRGHSSSSHHNAAVKERASVA